MQNIPGASILERLESMAKKAAGRPFILVNPALADRPSHSGIMGARGREERMAFADSFATVFAFQTLHVKGLYKIEGAIGKVRRALEQRALEQIDVGGHGPFSAH